MSSALLESPRLDAAESESAAPGSSTPRRESDDLQTIYDSFSRLNLKRGNIDWTVLGWMVLMHAGALAAPFFFNWTALAVAIGLHWLTASIGICLTYHRYLSHRSLKLRQPVEFLAVLCGVLSGEGTPLQWSANHRLHHKRSDLEGDPHSPLEGPWWSHMFWLFVKRTPEQKELLYQRFIPELMRRPMLWFFERTFVYWLVASGVILFVVGGLPMLLWGLCVRMIVAYHSTWFVNSATHIWGYRNYKTRDESRNLWWVALLSYGEGWHNNHHAHPGTARAGHQWWEIDMTYWTIRLLRATGLAYDVKDRIPLAETPNVEGVKASKPAAKIAASLPAIPALSAAPKVVPAIERA